MRITPDLALAARLPHYVEEAAEADDEHIALRIGGAWLTLTPPQVLILSELAPLQIAIQSGLCTDWTIRHGVGKSSWLPLEALARPGKARDALLFILIGRAIRRFKGACALADFHARLADLFKMADAAGA